MMYALIIFMSLVACVLGFISEVTRGNIGHIKHGRKPEAGAAIFPVIPTVQIIAVLLAWGLNHLSPSLGFYTVITIFGLLYAMWIASFPKLKRELDETKKKRFNEPSGGSDKGTDKALTLSPPPKTMLQYV